MVFRRVFVRWACEDLRVTPRDPWRNYQGSCGVTQRADRWYGIGGVGTVARNHHKCMFGVFGTSHYIESSVLGMLLAPGRWSA